MFNSVALDVVIGLVFIYLLYSLLATILQEIVATYFSLRAKILERALVRMLEDENNFNYRISSIFYLFKGTGNGGKDKSMTAEFYNHPLMKFLGENAKHSKPSYITKESFSKVMLDLLRGSNVKPGDDIRILIQSALDSETTNWAKSKIDTETLSYLKSIWADSQGDVEKFKTLVENWFDETMNRATGWYKRYNQIILLFIGLIIAISFNVDTIKIATALEKDPKLREQLVQQADAYLKAHPDLEKELVKEKIENQTFANTTTFNSDSTLDSIAKINVRAQKDSISIAEYNKVKQHRDSLIDQASSLIKNDLNKVNSTIGIGFKTFDCKNRSWSGFFKSLIGWLITALAISLGAPFWFDLLNKLMKMRGAGTNPEEEKSNIEKKTLKQSTITPKG